MAEITPGLNEHGFQSVMLRMHLSALKSNELSPVKSSKNVLSPENHYCYARAVSFARESMHHLQRNLRIVLTGVVLLLQSNGIINKILRARTTQKGGQIAFTQKSPWQGKKNYL